MSGDPALELVRCAAAVGAAIDAVLDPLAALGRTAARHLPAPGRRSSTADDLAFLRPSIHALLREGPAGLHGAGVVAQPSHPADAAIHLEWWEREGGLLRPRPSNLDLHDERFSDHPRSPWFTVPRDEGRGVIDGPYVDLHGDGLYVMTFVLPVDVDGAFAGVVAGDVAVNTFARPIVPVLRRLGGAAVVTAEGRVVVATTPEWAVGALVGDTPPPGSHMERIAVSTPVAQWRVLRSVRDV
ncbi:cache domain-containing protein [Streptomyces sp. NPDC127068]|uniref:cache domain-containing protein n=1 Tax=Streptomyces sp. NPDC127068 TaxID=3347127 RepID=UPI003660F5B3